jgi:hypothetical protein
MSTPAQIKKIHTIKGKLGLNDETYRSLIGSIAQGKSSCKELTVSESCQLIERMLKDLGETPVKVAKPPKDGTDNITTDQQNLIQALREYGKWKPAQLAGFCMKNVKTPWPQTKTQGSKIIMALVSIHAEMILRHIKNLRKTEMKPSDLSFMYTHERNAQLEFTRFINSKRGQRAMPRLSLEWLFDILNRYPLPQQTTSTALDTTQIPGGN